MTDFACEGCSSNLNPGDKAHHCADGVDLCEKCAPTFGEMLSEVEAHEATTDEDPELTLSIRGWIEEHLAGGGALTDKAVRPIPFITDDEVAHFAASAETRH